MTTPRTLRKPLILAVLLLSTILIWLDNTILAATFETLADPIHGLGASPAELQWATGAYTLAFAPLMLTAGAVGDRFGHRTVLVAGMAIFGVASLWAGYADHAGQLIAARAAMGIGSALIAPASMAVLLWTFSGAARATAIGISGASAGVGVAGGPLLAGILLDHFAWGSVFLINVPITGVALIGIFLLIPNFRSVTPRRMDLAGTLLAIGGLTSLAYGLIRAGQITAWDSAPVWATIAGGIVLLGAFVLVELRREQPSFDPRLLLHRQFGAGNAALGLLMFAMTAATFYSAFYLQGARGFSPMAAGLITSPVALGTIAGAPLGVRLARRYSIRTVSVTAMTTAGICMGSLAFFRLDTPLVVYGIVLLVQGASIAAVISPVTAALMGTQPLEHAGVAAAMNNTIRQTGSLFGIAVGGTIMSMTYRHEIEPDLSGYPAALQEQALISAEQARHAATVFHQPEITGAANDAFITAMHLSSISTTLIAFVAAAVLAFALSPTRSSRTSRDQTGQARRAPAPELI